MPNDMYFETISTFRDLPVTVMGEITSLEEALRNFDMYWNEAWEDVNAILDKLAKEAGVDFYTTQSIYHFYLLNRC